MPRLEWITCCRMGSWHLLCCKCCSQACDTQVWMHNSLLAAINIFFRLGYDNGSTRFQPVLQMVGEWCLACWLKRICISALMSLSLQAQFVLVDPNLISVPTSQHKHSVHFTARIMERPRHGGSGGLIQMQHLDLWLQNIPKLCENLASMANEFAQIPQGNYLCLNIYVNANVDEENDHPVINHWFLSGFSMIFSVVNPQFLPSHK